MSGAERSAKPKRISDYPVDRTRRCEANTVKGRRCRNSPVVGSPFCPSHLDPENPRGMPSRKWEDAKRALDELDEDRLREFQDGTREFEDHTRALVDEQTTSRDVDEPG